MFPRYNTVKEGGKDGRSWTWVRWELLVPSSSTAFFFFSPVLLFLEQVDYMMPLVKYQIG